MTEQQQQLRRMLGLWQLDKHSEVVDHSPRFGTQVEELVEVGEGEGHELSFDVLSLRYLWDCPVGRWKL